MLNFWILISGFEKVGQITKVINNEVTLTENYEVHLIKPYMKKIHMYAIPEPDHKLTIAHHAIKQVFSSGKDAFIYSIKTDYNG